MNDETNKGPKIVELRPTHATQQHATLVESLRILDDLKARLINGSLIAVTGVAIDKDDGTYSFMAAAQPVSNLRVSGALNWYNYMYMKKVEGTDDDQENEPA